MWMRRGRTTWRSPRGELRPLPKFSLLRWKPGGPRSTSVVDWTLLSRACSWRMPAHFSSSSWTRVPGPLTIWKEVTHSKKNLPVCLVWGVPNYRMLSRSLGRQEHPGQGRSSRLLGCPAWPQIHPPSQGAEVLSDPLSSARSFYSSTPTFEDGQSSCGCQHSSSKRD